MSRDLQTNCYRNLEREGRIAIVSNQVGFMEVAILLMRLEVRTLWKTEQESIGRTVSNLTLTGEETSKSSRKARKCVIIT